MAQGKQQSAGMGVDAWGGPTIDPTANVIALTEAANRRQDDLRALNREMFDRDVSHLKEIVGLHSHYQDRVSRAESSRVDSIRQVDREEVKQMRLEAQSAIKALADTTLTMADTLRNQQASTASTLAKSQQDQWNEMNKRVAAVELTQSEGTGKGTGAKNLYSIIALGVGLLVTLFMAAITIGGIIVAIAYAIRK